MMLSKMSDEGKIGVSARSLRIFWVLRFRVMVILGECAERIVENPATRERRPPWKY
jgi:hypothetical protein